MGKKKKTYKMNVIKCSVCGWETEYGNGWAFLSSECAGFPTKEQLSDRTEYYHLLISHKWKKIGEKEY